MWVHKVLHSTGLEKRKRFPEKRVVGAAETKRLLAEPGFRPTASAFCHSPFCVVCWAGRLSEKRAVSELCPFLSFSWCSACLFLLVSPIRPSFFSSRLLGVPPPPRKSLTPQPTPVQQVCRATRWPSSPSTTLSRTIWSGQQGSLRRTHGTDGGSNARMGPARETRPPETRRTMRRKGITSPPAPKAMAAEPLRAA